MCSVSLFLWLPMAICAGELASSVEQLVERAEDLELHKDPYWLLLVHYEKRVGGYTSRVDDPAFFLAGDGRKNPRSELEATLRAFFEPVGDDEREHAICRFVARYHWLNEKLALSEQPLPMTDCRVYRDFYDAFQPRSATLVFPAAHVSSPASMFGHTLLVFDAKGKNRLISSAISYAARTDETIGPLFAAKGILGLYRGYYEVLPYYEKVEEYGDLSHRDIWEYEFDFTQEEVDRMLMHAWEIQSAYSHYYFFSENCSYNILYIIDAGRPSLRLSERFDKPFVVPAETVKVINDLDIVRDVYYRPATTSKLRYLASTLPAASRDLAREVAWGVQSPDAIVSRVDGKTNQIIALDLASEYTQYLYASRQVPEGDYRKRLLAALKVRSKLGESSADLYSVPEPTRPERGHGPNRFGLGFGYQESDAFWSLRYRPVYHGEIDAGEGYDVGPHLQFFNAEARYYVERGDLELERFDLIDIASVYPRDALFHPTSWKVLMGWAQKKFERGDDALSYRLNTGGGLAYTVNPLGVVSFMIETEGWLGSTLDAGYALGGGPSLGLIMGGTGVWKGVAHAKAAYFPLNDAFWSYECTLDQSLRLSEHHSVVLEFAHEANDSFHMNEVAFYWHYLF